MAEQIEQDVAVAPEGTGTRGFAEVLNFVGELAKLAAKGDRGATSMLKILENQQLAAIRALEAESESLKNQVTIQIMSKINDGILRTR